MYPKRVKHSLVLGPAPGTTLPDEHFLHSPYQPYQPASLITGYGLSKHASVILSDDFKITLADELALGAIALPSADGCGMEGRVAGLWLRR